MMGVVIHDSPFFLVENMVRFMTNTPQLFKQAHYADERRRKTAFSSTKNKRSSGETL